MSYTLIGSARSPFARACRMFLESHHLPYQFRVLNFVDDPQAAAELSKETPINRVPYLVDEDGQKVFDSRVIVNYLSRKHRLPGLSIEQENILSSIYSAMDAAVALFLLRKDGVDTAGTGFFVSRQRERIPSNLKFLTPWAKSLRPDRSGDWNFPAMALYSFLYWGNARGILQVSDYPEMQEFLDRFKSSPGVEGTGF